MAKEKMVLVGCKTLSAPILKPNGDPIRYGETVEAEGDALAYAKRSTTADKYGNIHQMFEPATSMAAKRAVAKAKGEPMPEEEATGARRSRRRTAQ